MPTALPGAPAPQAISGIKPLTGSRRRCLTGRRIRPPSMSLVRPISLSPHVTEVNGITFDAGASAYTFEVIPPVILTISGAGIVNNSGTTQNLCHARSCRQTTGSFSLPTSPRQATGIIFMNRGSSFAGNVAATEFHDNSNAGTSTFVNVAPFADFSGGGVTLFYDHSSAGSSTIISEAPQWRHPRWWPQRDRSFMILRRRRGHTSSPPPAMSLPIAGVR